MKFLPRSIYVVIALLSLSALAACGDDPDPGEDTGVTSVSCEEDATQPKCTPKDVSCDVDPSQDKCTLDEDSCAVSPNQPKCNPEEVSCDEDPTQAKCVSEEKSCTEDPNQQKCFSDEKSCEEDPTQAKCETATPFCELPENVDKPECTRPFAREEPVYSYVNSLALPAEGEACCWDYMAGNNNDPDGYNNTLGELFDLVADLVADINVGDLLDDLFWDGDLTLIFEHTDFPEVDPADSGVIHPGVFDIALYMGEIEVDADNGNLPTVSAADRLAGNGRFILGEQLAEIEGASIGGNVIYAETDTLQLPLPLLGTNNPDFDHELAYLFVPAILPLTAVRLRFDVEALTEDPDVSGIKTTTDAQGDLITDDQGKSINFLAGGINGDEYIANFNSALVAGCDLDAGAQAVVFDGTQSGDPELGPDPSAPVPPLLTMDAEVVAQLAASSDSVCSMIGGLGDALGGILGGFFDVDSTGNGVANAMSVGLNLGFVGVDEIIE